MYQMIYRISINMYRYEYRIEKTDRYPALEITRLLPCISYFFFQLFVWLLQIGQGRTCQKSVRKGRSGLVAQN